MAKLTTCERDKLRRLTSYLMVRAVYRQIAPYWNIGKPTAEWVEAAKQLRHEVLNGKANDSATQAHSQE